MDGLWASFGDESVAEARIACPSSCCPDGKFLKVFKVDISSSSYELVQNLADLKSLNSRIDYNKQALF